MTAPYSRAGGRFLPARQYHRRRMLCHWDDVERTRREVGDMRSWWRRLGTAAGATEIGVARVEIDPGARIGPVHVHGAEEEVFYVLGGSGLAWLDGAVHEIGPRDTVVCPAGGPAHTLIAGDEGLDVLAFGENIDPPLVHLPRAGVLRRAGFWTLAGEDPPPLEREAAAGPLELPEPSPRPPCIVALDDAPIDVDEKGEFAWTEHYLSHEAGGVRTGLRHAVIPAGKATCPPHWHSGEHELFVILGGEGTLLLYNSLGALRQEHALRAGHVVSCPAGSGFAHMFRAGAGDMTMLLYGQRNGNEIIFYPRSKKAWVGQVLVRFDVVEDYWDGEV
jgi:uncharacterized cupin superfamily protein